MRQAAINLIIDNGLILAISRRHDPSKFGLPGGKVNESETLEQTAKREAREETGIIIKSCVPVFVRDELGDKEQVMFQSHCFYALDWSGAPRSSEEGNVRWMTAHELTNTHAAFGDYNRNMLNNFRNLYPEVYLLGE